MPLDTSQKRKLVVILELATRATFDGERLAALNRAKDIMDKGAVRWADIVGVASFIYSWRDAAKECINDKFLTEWEIEFLTSIITKTRDKLSDKQEVVFKRICNKCGVEYNMENNR
jgi:hypothetical protein